MAHIRQVRIGARGRRRAALGHRETAARCGNLPEAIERIRQRACAGHVLEQVQWGQVLRDSVYMPPRPDLAFRWFEGAALAGFGPGLNMLGRCYQFGWGCTQDLTRAAACFEQAALKGDAWGCYNLAILTMRGMGVARDLARALSLFRAGAKAGHAKSMNLYARFLEEGWEVPQDRAQAEAWYRRSAEEGDYRGQHNYATLLCDRGDDQEALMWWRKAVHEATSDILLAMQARLESRVQAAGALCHEEESALLDLVRQRLAGLELDVGLPLPHETVS
ncbi:tetratricopeptide repeat protein [Asaia bogorensis]|uniref:tetratricopeptide repeat protein n=1 Tax=Asaia bogorensis TaxID=91915 RepID=UPI000EFD20EA|nr:tetratricopeptide repeat protein [Asaia bogorensis]